jgi:spore coat polysaccharide biosynthesis predicted glycosyltransferase SpsG
VRRVVRLYASAGPGEGRGHLARALSLAEAVWPAGVEVELAVVRGKPTLDEGRRAEAAGARLIDADAPLPAGSVVVLDVPRPDMRIAGVGTDRLVVFDDSHRFRGEAAIVVQPSLPEWSGSARAGRVLAGYRWAPIGAAWRAWIDRAHEARADGGPRVVVCFGGSDPHDVTGRLTAALLDDAGWSTTIVVGADYRGRASGGTDTVRDPGDLPARVATADLAVIGAGTMKFEVAAVGRPALLLAVADDQIPVGPPFAATGAARWLGDGRTIDPGTVRAAVADLLADEPSRVAMAAAARDQVDGAGADRLAAEIAALSGKSDQASAS